MNSVQLRREMKRHKLSLEMAAHLFDCQPRTIRRWLKDEWSIPRPVMLLFRLMKKHNTPLRDLRVSTRRTTNAST